MAIDQLTAKIYNKLSKANLAGAEGKVAVQFNLTGKVTGVFYIEILNGVPSVMPYEYIDHDAIVSGSLTNIEKPFLVHSPISRRLLHEQPLINLHYPLFIIPFLIFYFFVV